MNQSTVSDLSNMLPFWQNLKEEERERILHSTVLNNYAGGSNIRGKEGDCAGVVGVREGRLRAYLQSEEGKEVTLFRLVEGDVCLLSASCIMKNIAFDVFMDAECDTALYVINPAAYEEIAKENSAVGNFMTELLSMRFSEAMWVMEQILFMKMDKRLAIFLLEQASLEGGDTVTLTHEQIAGHLGTAREVISRMLKYFSNEEIISLSRKGIKILNRKKLTSFTAS